MQSENSSSKVGQQSDDQIIDRGRGPELAGTRITVYRIMDYSEDDYSPSEIAAELGITELQVQSALAYIREHQDTLNAQYRLILDRVNRPNAPSVEQGRAKTAEELRRRIVERRLGKGAHDRPVRQ